MIPTGLITRLPSAATILILANIYSPVSGHVMPRETGSTSSSYSRAIVDWPLAPTPVPLLPAELRKRQFNTVCGYIGGDPDKAATCRGNSHCVADVDNKIIGCCPNEGECKSGIFTGCVDANNPSPSTDDPLLYTCAPGNVCYKNSFDGGFIQYGCGADSSLAASVATTAAGKSAVVFSQVTDSFSISPTSLVIDNTVQSSSADSSSSSATSTRPSETAAQDAPASTHKMKHTGAIVGGTIGGVVAAAILITLLLWFLRRRSKSENEKDAPGSPFITRPYAGDGGKSESQPLAGAMTESSMGNPRPAPAPPADRPVASPEGWKAPQDWETTAPARTYNNQSPTDEIDTSMDADNIPLNSGPHAFPMPPENAIKANGPNPHIATQANGYWTHPKPRRSGNGVLWQQNRKEARA